jgi:hypothetical protein
MNITHQRLLNQSISQPLFATPEELVTWMGAVQSQDFAAAKWALGLRMPGLTEQVIDDAFNEGRILRTHVLRPTWHFVVPDDIHWMLELTAPHILDASAYHFRQQELDKKMLSKANKIIEQALRDVEFLERDQLKEALNNAGVNTDGLRFTHYLFYAELDRIICSGPRIGKQFTYALLDKRAKANKKFTRDEALAELTKRYFNSHGPAALQDYMWWSGLSMKEAKRGLEMILSDLQQVQIEDSVFWFSKSASLVKRKSPAIHLLPTYDEYTVAYQNRAVFLDPKNNAKSGNGIFKPVVIIDGKVQGVWSRTLKKDSVAVTVKTFGKASDVEKKKIKSAVNSYGKFLEKDVVYK